MRALTCIFLSFLLVHTSSSLFSQVTTAGINGVVRDADKNVVSGASVKALHVPSGTTYGTITQNDGHFSIQGMRAGGPYTLEITSMGMSEIKVNDIVLNLGESYILNVRFQNQEEEALDEVKIVANKNALMNSDRTGAATNINSRTLSRMPTITRSLTDFTRLTPQANGNGFAGRDGRYNNLQIDGANFNNGFGLSSDPLPGGGNQPVSLDAIEEIQVNVSPYDVRQTGFTGAGINAITRSGTNDLSGSVYGFLRPKSFTGLQVAEDQLSENARISSEIIGGRIGGALIKNKLFFFLNFEYENQSASGNNWLATRPGTSGPNIARTKAEDLEAVRNHLISEYGYDPGKYENYANTYNNKNFKGLARLDWNINDQHKLTLRYNQMQGTSMQGANANSGPNPRSSANRIGSESITFENGNYSFKNTVHSVTGELNSIFSNKLSNQFLATYSRIQDTRQTPGDLFPFVDIWEDGRNYMSFGTELFSYNNDVINNNISITNNITYQTGKHNITGGLNFQTMSYGNSYVRMGTSYYRYESVSDFLNNAPPSVYGISYPYQGRDSYARVKFGMFGIYIQDQLQASDRLKLTAGLRVDMPLFFDKPISNPVVDTLTLLDKNGKETNYTTGFWPKSNPLFSPRIGFNWDALGDRSLQLRGGTGIFTGNIPFVWFTNMPTNAGVIQNQMEPVNEETQAKITHLEKDPMYWPNQLPGSFPKEPGTRAPGGVNFIDRNFKMPQVWRTNFGVDYKIQDAPVVLSFDLIYTKDINAVYQFNANRKAAQGSLNYSGDQRDFWNGSSNARYNAATGNIIPVLSNTNKGYSLATTLGATITPINGLGGSLFYTYSAAEDVTGNPGSAANSAWSNNYSINDPNELLLGYSQYAIPHRFVGNVSYRIEYAGHLATTLSLFYQGSNQGRYTYTYDGDINQDGVSLDLLYIPTASSELNFVDITRDGEILFTKEEQKDAFDKFVNNERALSSKRGGYVDRNSGLMPWLNKWDLRIMQDLFVTTKNNKRHTLQLSLDIMNVGNLLSKNWGLYKQLNGGSDYNYVLLRVVNVTDDGVPSFNMITVTENQKTRLPDTPYRNLFSTSSTWGMQIGLRYIF